MFGACTPLCWGGDHFALITEARGGQRGRSELAQDTPGFMQGQGGSGSPSSADSPASSPDLVFQVVKGPEPQRSSLKGETQPPVGPGHTQLSGLCSRCSVTAAPSGPPLLPRSLPPAEAGLTWSLFQARRLAHLRP